MAMDGEQDREKQLEDAKMRWLKRYTDWVVKRLMEDDFDEVSGAEFLTLVRSEVLKRFPDKAREYNLIYRRRFVRILLRKGIFLNLPEDESVS